MNVIVLRIFQKYLALNMKSKTAIYSRRNPDFINIHAILLTNMNEFF